MGQSQTHLKQNQDYRLVEQLPVGNIVKHNKTESLHFLKQYSFTAQQAYQNALNMHSLRLANKNQHILNFLHFTTKSQNSFCSSFHKIILIFEYSDHSLEKDIINRARQHQPFNQKEIWSILCSCVLAAVHLIHCQGKMHCGLASKDIRLTPSGCIKLLSHQMIGIDSNHCQAQGIPKTLAITLIECINLQKITNQDDRYLQQMIEKLDCSRDMKEILILMLNKNITFVELQEHLFKLVQDDESLASHSNTPVLKAQSPIQSDNKQFKCPRINRNSTKLSFQTHLQNEQKGKTEQLDMDSQDIRSYLFNLEQSCIEEENPDETDQPEQQQKQVEQGPKQINSFYLRERKLDNMNNSKKLQQSIKSGREQKYKNNNININKELNNMSSMQNIKITKSYQINILHSSRRKENQNLIGKNEPISVNNSIKTNNYQLNSIQSQDNLFTDPKLFSLIKSDLEDIKMRRSIGELGKFTKTQQFVTNFNHIQKQSEYHQQNQNILSSYQVSQVKNVDTFTQNSSQSQTSTKLLQQQQSKIKIMQPLNNISSSPTTTKLPISIVNEEHWSVEQKPSLTLPASQSSNVANGFKIQHTFNSINMNGMNNIQMIRQVSQQYREQQEDRKSKHNRSTHQQNDSNDKKQSPFQTKSQKQANISKIQQQRIQNIMSDNQLGFKKKKQSTAKFQYSKQNTVTQVATTTNSTIQAQQASSSASISNSSITSNAIHVNNHVTGQLHPNEQNRKKQKDWFEPQNKNKIKGTFRQIQSEAQLAAQNSSNQNRYEQYSHDYSRSQSQSRLSSNCSRNDNRIKYTQDKDKQKETLVHVNQNYTRGRYQGTKLNGKRHGYGTFYYSEGGKYVGNWKQNKMHGKGILYYPNQKVAYDGEWENDQLSGYGVLFNEQVAPLRNPFDYRDWTDVEDYWVKYQGNFYQDNKQGQGKLYIVNGQRLEAQFHDDKVDGEGILYRGDGSCVKGKWRQNKLIRMF